ncbi:hypothetical protein BU23DRAFT_589236 [Bimuria novae-zelandiae CBS 107.79]|uniref:Uncharacterized protein n=1 Tax=Bimuria novae-zelandiae CBS 107.79 TaxID=1447943 RepID=A0A6A5VFZ8_9PLEO|nr:hypothetical protein BU23DRAFT_589236 [Bimuria novae-zelandiae CBS 107.79]
MAASKALANRQILSNILHHLSDMNSDQTVEFLEFRPTLVPAILVNCQMAPERRQYYANKVYYVFLLSPLLGSAETLDFLDSLAWPNLKSLELEVDLQRYGSLFVSMLHDGLEHVELFGYQSGGVEYFAATVLPALFGPCKNLRSIRIGLDTIMDDDPVHTIEVKSANLMDKDALFTRLSQRIGLEGLEIDLDPGVALLPLLSGPNAFPSPFASLKRASIMCYPDIAIALPVHLSRIEELHIFDDVIAEMCHCSDLRLLKIGVGSLAADFPSSTSLPRLSGAPLSRLAETCPRLEDLNLLAAEPAAIDGLSILSVDFDNFCTSLPGLRNLSLKLHPTTMATLQTTALHRLGKCPELKVLRLKIACQLPSLPVPDAVPRILVSSDGATPESIPQRKVLPIFPKLKHLALCHPDTALAPVPDLFTGSVSSQPSSIVDPSIEEELVRSWAQPLLTHFPCPEMLEAWGDFAGHDNESLNYFLPTEEILATTWEFLSGIEQDLWEDDGEAFEVEDGWESLEDWEKASLMISKLNVHDEELEDMVTLGRTLEVDGYFE